MCDGTNRRCAVIELKCIRFNIALAFARMYKGVKQFVSERHDAPEVDRAGSSNNQAWCRWGA